MKVDYDYRFIVSTSYTNFFEISIGNMLYWKSHIDQLLPELLAARCAVKSSKPIHDSRNICDGLPWLLSLDYELRQHFLG